MEEKPRWYLGWDENGRYMGDVCNPTIRDIGWTYEEFTPKACPKPELPDGLYLVRYKKYGPEWRMKRGDHMHHPCGSASEKIENYTFLHYFGTGEELSPELKRHYGEE